MVTRHLTIIYYQRKYAIAQYGQWDGYPSGAGKYVLDFVRDAGKLARLREAIASGKLYTPSEAEHERWRAQEKEKQPPRGRPQHKREPSWRKRVSSLTTKSVRPSLHRDTGPEILDLVANATDRVPLNDIGKSLDFIANTQFCEWAYVVDLDANMLEVWAGKSDHSIPSARFNFLGSIIPGEEPNLVARFKLDALPTLEEFVREAGDLRRDQEGQYQLTADILTPCPQY